MKTTVGIDVGGTKMLAVLLSEDGHVLAEHKVHTPHGANAVMAELRALFVELQMRAADLNVPTPHACGVGIPGLVTLDGVFQKGPNLPRIENFDFSKALHESLGGDVSVYVDNDANTGAWGERTYGAGNKRNHVIMVTLGTGIGGGIVFGGEVMRGARGFAGEIGHMVVNVNGPLCPCGQSGCWERYASGSGLGMLAREAAHASIMSPMVAIAGGDPEMVRGEHVVTAANEGDEVALGVIDQYAYWVALGLGNLSNIFDNEVFVIGGGVIVAGDLVMEPVRKAYRELLYARECDILPASLGEVAGAIGAADLARLGATA